MEASYHCVGSLPRSLEVRIYLQYRDSNWNSSDLPFFVLHRLCRWYLVPVALAVIDWIIFCVWLLSLVRKGFWVFLPSLGVIPVLLMDLEIVRGHTCTHTRTQTHTYMHMHTHTYAHTHAHMRSHRHTHKSHTQSHARAPHHRPIDRWCRTCSARKRTRMTRTKDGYVYQVQCQC